MAALGQRQVRWAAERGVRAAMPRLAGLAVLAGVLALRAWDPTPMEVLRLKAMDLLQQVEPRPDTIRPVTIVDIDDESLAEVGQWPWPRTTLATLVRNLGQAGAVAIAFDAVFPEPDRMSPDQIAAALPQLGVDTADALRELPSNDEVFAATIRGAPVVLGQSGRRNGGQGVDGAKVAPYAEVGADPDPFLFAFDGLLRNVPTLERSATAVGMINIEPEVDGVVRRVPAVVRVEDTLFPALSLELMRLALRRNAAAQGGALTFGVRSAPHGVSNVFFQLSKGGASQNMVLPTDEHGRWWVHFAPYAPDRYVPAKDVLAGTAPPEKIRGKLILVGTSAIGLHDLKTTPLGTVLPGVEVHAQLIEAAMSGEFLTRPNHALTVEIAAAAGIALLMVVLVPMLGALRTLALGAVLSLGTVFGAYYAFAEQRLVYDATLPLATGLMVYAVLVYMSYIREEAQRRQVREAFAHYVSPAVMERVVEHPETLRLGGQMRDLTVLFCDIRGFTTISEAYDAEGLTRLINRFLTPMTQVILDHDGTIDKYMGDCIMAFWNAPLDDPDHARNACRAALTMIERLETLNDELANLAREEGTPYTPIAVGIGLNTGECCVGNMGSEQRFDYSVLGDDVNLASRLEGQTKSYGVRIILGENTQRLASDMGTLELDLIRVKGKERPVRIHGLLRGEESAPDPDFQAHKALHDAMLAAYRAKDWATARANLSECRATAIGAGLGELYAMYEARIAAFEQDPPPADWDGVYAAETK